MNVSAQTALFLNDLNTAFYAHQSDSFSQTRKAPWPGWVRALDVLIEREIVVPHCGCSVLDVACGNLRFEGFLTRAYPQVNWSFTGVDNCVKLIPEDSQVAALVAYKKRDVVADLFACQPESQKTYDSAMLQGQHDVAVSFGFMHHLPTPVLRQSLLDLLIKSVRPGGVVIVSLWQFMNNESLAEKALLTTVSAQNDYGLPELDKNDYYVGWKNEPGVFRYCHSFSEKEIDTLVESCSPQSKVIARYEADGRTGNLNTYLVLQTSRCLAGEQ